jgi:meso-butanediol dehydrogenase/(S,S)-butanediol dehydrogenase/diacetyl reductase
MQRFTDKVVLITGAASGIGRAAAERMAAEGAAIFAVDVQKEALDGAVKQLRAAGARAEGQLCDISNEAQVKACIKACVDKFGKIDVLCNMAGILKFVYTHECSLELFNKIITVNLTGTFLMCREALPELIKTRGNIINAASTAALQGLPWGAAYGASKAAILSMTRSIAVDYAKQGVRANCIAPGDILTPLATNVTFPEGADFSAMARCTSLTGAKGPEVVAGVIAMLGSEDGVHITGECIRMDGGTLA